MRSKCEAEQKQWGRRKPYDSAFGAFTSRGCRSRPWGGSAPLFIVHQRPIIASVTGKFTFLPRRPPLTTVKSPKGRTRLLLGSAPAWAVRGSFEARFLPCGRLVVSSAHLGDGTTLTDEGLLLVKWPSEAFTTSGRADGFGSHVASAIRGKFCNGGLTETLMLLELCEFCCAGAAHLSGAGLRAESTDGRLSAPKVWRNQKRRASGAPRLGDGGGPGEMS
jgi:hypothetical protein